MDKIKIGVFDSGLGGLTAVRVLRELLPADDIIYLGDTARAPYGSRSVAELREIAASDTRFLTKYGVDAILVACGTVSSNCLDTVRESAGVPVLGVVRAAAREALVATRSGRIGVLATVATAQSGAFTRELAALGAEAEPISVGSPLLVPFVEAGRVSPEDAAVMRAVETATARFRQANVDTLILGCTHFPLLYEAISRCMGEGVRLIDSGAAAARELCESLGRGGLSDGQISGSERYYTSGDAGEFCAHSRLFLGRDVSGHVFPANL